MQRFIQVDAIHANNALTSSESGKTFRRKTTVADEQASCPGGFLLNLSVEDVKVSYAGLLPLPLRLDEIGSACKLKAALNLLPSKAKWIARIQPISIKKLL